MTSDSGSQALRKASSAVALIVACSTTLLAAAMLVAAQSRIASHVDLSAPGSAGRTLLTQAAAALMLLAGVLAPKSNARALGTRTWVAMLSTVLTVFIIGGFTFTPWSVVVDVVVDTAVVLAGITAWAAMTRRAQIWALMPLLVLCGLSVLSYAWSKEYLFPWYNTWALVAVLLAGYFAFDAFVARREDKSRQSPILAAVLWGVLLASIALSSSRQGAMALGLIACAALYNSRNFSSKIRVVALGAMCSAVLWFGLSASERLADLGSVTQSNGREALYATAIEFLQSSPVTGLAWRGIANYQGVLVQLGHGWSTSVHNFVLDCWLRGGLLAAVASSTLLIRMCWVRRSGDRGLVSFVGIGAIPFFLLGSQLLYFESLESSLFLSAFLGLGGAVAARHNATQEIISHG